MSAPLNLSNSSACCAPQCSDVAVAQVPGPAGHDGTDGLAGAAGKNAYTLTTASFVMPAVAGVVNIAVVSSAWCANGQVVYVTTAGYFRITNLFDSTHIQILNLGYTGNTAPASNIVSPQQVSPAGIKGTDGTAPSTTLNALSPTTTRGDLILDNGALSPSASDVRLAVGTNGQALVADSAQPTGVKWGTITPNASTDNAIARFDGAVGTPLPVQTSKVIITDDGSIQASGSGGNARGTMAVDLQVARTGVAQVASGLRSGVLSGESNTASGTDSFVGGGNTNRATNPASGVCCGNTNLATGDNAFIGGGANNNVFQTNGSVCGGNGNNAIGANAFVGGGNGNGTDGTNSGICAGISNFSGADNAFIGGGSNNDAEGQCSSIVGGVQGKTRLYGQNTHASGMFAAVGDAQYSRLIARNNTVDATSTVLFLDGISLRLTVPIDTALAVRGYVLGRSSAGACGYYSFTVGIKNNGGVTSLIGAATVAVAVADAGWPGGASVTVSADVVNNALNFAVVGAAATLIRWLATMDISELGY